MALCIPGNIYCICGFLCINKPSYRKLPAYRGVVRPFIGKWIRFSSIFPHLCRLIQHYQGTLFTFCQSDCRLAYKNNEFHGFSEVIVDDERLATTLAKLPELRQEVLLLYYFIGYRDEAIGRLYGRCRSTINHRRNVALKQLRKEWERLEHEEQKTDTV